MLDPKMKLSIIIPCFNEKNTIVQILEKIKKISFIEKEVIIVDDSSTDGTRDIIKNLKRDLFNKIIFNEKNKGKGYAVRTGLKEATGDLILIQDADLEYDPEDYIKLIDPFIKFNADVVYGSRFLGGSGAVRLHFFWHLIANKILTIFCNIFTNLNMSDMETCYKVFKRSAIKPDELMEDTFGFEPEITIKLAKKKLRFFEVGISYNGRNYSEGKKIKFKDALIAFVCIIKYGIR
jgi:glycosyltransferase involved in cell wall biosynthesis